MEENTTNNNDDNILKDAIRQAENMRIRGMLSEWEEAERAKDQSAPKRVRLPYYWRIAASLLLLIAAALLVRPPKADKAIAVSYDEALRLSIPSTQKGTGTEVPSEASDSLFTIAKNYLINKQYVEALQLLEAMPEASQPDDLDFLLLLSYFGTSNRAKGQMILNKIKNNPKHKYFDEIVNIHRQRSWRIQWPSLTD